MASSTRHAIEAARATLDAQGGVPTLETAEQLLAAARIIEHSVQLRAMLADASTPAEEKSAIVTAVFGSRFGQPALEILISAAQQRWSSGRDLLTGIEELGIRAATRSAAGGSDLESELFAIGRAVASDAELELALGSKLNAVSSKTQLLDTLLASKTAPQTLVIVRHLVQSPRGRRIGVLVRLAASIVADEAGLAVATVTSARRLDDALLDRLRAGLSRNFGRDLKLNPVVDPRVIGGIRVQVGDRVLDASVSSRLHDLRLQLST